MGHILAEVWPFIASVFSHWHVWLSGGGLGGVIVIGVALVERLSNKSLSKRAHIYLFLIAFFLCACFLSWVEKDDSLHAAERTITQNEQQYANSLGAATHAYNDLQAHCQYQAGVVDTLGQQNRDQQNSINNCQNQALKLLVPPGLHLTSILLRYTRNPQGNGTVIVRYLVLTNKDLSPVKLRVTCNRKLLSAEIGTVGFAHASYGTSGTVESEKAARVEMTTPPLTSTNPIYIDLLFQEETPPGIDCSVGNI